MTVLVLFAVVAAVELVGVGFDLTLVQWLAKPLLAPLLLLWWWQRRRRMDPVAVGLVFATAGDVALLIDSPVAFLVGMGFFLGTQLSFLTAFLRRRRPPLPVFVGYLALWALLNVLLWSRLGPLRLPILGYSLALTAMAAAAVGIGRRVAVGGALFLVSDLLIGLGAAGLTLPAQGLLVMSTYIAALLLITTGWAATTDDPVPGPAHAPSGPAGGGR
ncbi:lysoplasmalogenase [Micromonospora echinofusca]|uniref:Lysoplasmalogenase n=1 Tax=Micromonospora echinofusca TaxID=47858 RepID=A0ABS3VKG3_MICEH|nr:lysoplasmalogenase [Micromonospora echinofusca]MBO4205021.1 lysoplasmalogenase [Micromonospora echinofusca]